jgi:hypothetical protein
MDDVTAEYWQQHDARTYECCRVWAEYEIARYIGAWAKHQFENAWCDAIGEIIAEERHSVRKQITEATKTLQARIAELETALQNNEKRHAEAVEQATQRITVLEAALEGEMAATREAIDAIKRQSDDTTKSISDLEGTYWSHRETQTKQITDKLQAFERHADDVSSELKEVRGDLARATDTAHQIHQMEMRLDERRIREQENKRGPKGAMGPPGPQGERGLAGRDGKDGHTVVLKTKKWEINVEDYLAREILSDGSRMPALNFRPVLERLMPEIDLRVQSMVEQVIAEALRRGPLQPW